MFSRDTPKSKPAPDTVEPPTATQETTITTGGEALDTTLEAFVLDLEDDVEYSPRATADQKMAGHLTTITEADRKCSFEGFEGEGEEPRQLLWNDALKGTCP